MTQRLRWLAISVVLALTLAACNGSSADTTLAAGEGTAPTEENGDGGSGAAPECSVDEVDGPLNFYNWSDYIDPDLITAFEEQYDVDVVETFYDSNETMIAQIQAGVVYDLIVPSDYMVAILIEEGMIAPLNKDAIPNIENVSEQFQGLYYDETFSYSVPYQWGTTGLGVNLSVLGTDFPRSWALVFDPELTASYPSGVSLLNDPRETIGAALIYLGYSLNETSEDALQEAADLIRASNVTTFDSDQYPDNLVNGEVPVSHGYSGNFFTTFAETENPDNWEYVIPEEGATLWVDNLAIPTAADHPCTAHTFINFLLDAENGAQLSEWTLYATPNAAAEELLDPEIREDPAIYPDDETFERLETIQDQGDAEILYTDYFNMARGG
ncbi:MAG: spermidine/putrescine ABC transporter substrate-binding protein [Actinomycetes bacterium]